jgi:predicted outer membrane repeat protein
MKLMKMINVRSTIMCCAMFLISFLYAGNGLANVYTVTNTTDGLAVNQLRGAILAADAAGPGPHTINVTAGTYTLTLGTIVFGNNPETISIIGAGAATTVISMTTGAGKDRIFLINPVATTNSPIISISGITFQNAYLTSDAFGGGAIYSGGGTSEILTLTNCAFLNNTVPAGNGGGAAVKIDPRGNLSVDNCTFTNNLSNDADGGAILFIIYGSGVGPGFGTLSVTNSTFTGNAVNNPTSNADGGAISIRSQGGVTSFNATVNNNTFINNSADQFGGAILVDNGVAGSTVQIHFNRFINNTSGLSALTSGLYTAGAGGVVIQIL